jgi:hypothetical protein
MRTTRPISVYLEPIFVDKLDAARGNFNRSSWIEHILLEAMETK